MEWRIIGSIVGRIIALPGNLKAVIKRDSIKLLPIFEFMGSYVDTEEMCRTFNMGVGMILVVNPEKIDIVFANSDGYVIGELASGQKGVKSVGYL